MKFWISFYIPTPETIITLPEAEHVSWRYLTTANPHVLIEWVLLAALNEWEAKDKIVAHYGPEVLWRRVEAVSDTWVPPRHEDLL